MSLIPGRQVSAPIGYNIYGQRPADSNKSHSIIRSTDDSKVTHQPPPTAYDLLTMQVSTYVQSLIIINNSSPSCTHTQQRKWHIAWLALKEAKWKWWKTLVSKPVSPNFRFYLEHKTQSQLQSEFSGIEQPGLQVGIPMPGSKVEWWPLRPSVVIWKTVTWAGSFHWL